MVLRKRRPKFTREDMEFLLLVVGQAAAAFEAARLQAKAEEVAVLEERARIARDLHDGSFNHWQVSTSAPRPASK